jgi:uncharacterized protein (TIGR03118 family)
MNMSRTWWCLVATSASFLSLASSARGDSFFTQIDLVSNVPGLAATTDPNLVNPWGISNSATSPYWIADQGTGLSTVYNGLGAITPLVVPIPGGGGATSGPTGIVDNTTGGGFLVAGTSANFIFATLQGTIAARTTGSTSTTVATVSGASFTGLALANNGSANYLYAANFISGGGIQVFDSTFAPTTLTGGFVDPNLPAGYAPFNIQTIGGKLYVEYAKVSGTVGAPTGGLGLGVVDIFDTNGNLLQRLVSGGQLNAPWGIALAPAGFGSFGNDIMIGNFGNGQINAFDPTTGNYIGTVSSSAGTPIVNFGLWALEFGNGSVGSRPDSLYFTAGIGGEKNGLFAAIQATPNYYFSQLAVGGGFQTTLTYVNYGTQAVTCTTNFFADSGAPLSVPFAQGSVLTRVDILQPGGSVHDQSTAAATAALSQGWAEASCTGPVEASLLYRLFQSGTAAGEASVSAEAGGSSKFVTFAQTATGVAYANPSTTQSAVVTFMALSAAGAQLGSTTLTLAPLAHSAFNVGPMLGLTNFTGSLQVTSTVPIVSLSLNAEAFPVFSSLPPGDLPAVPPTGPQTYYFSQLAFGGGFQTTLSYINYGSQAVTCTTNFLSDSGGTLLMPFAQGTISSRVDTIPAGGSVHDQTTASLTASVSQGWATASCTGPVQASLLYRLYQSGSPIGEASVNAETAPTTEFATFAQTATGVAYANPSTTQSASVTFALFSAAGTPLGTKIVTLGPLAHTAANLGPLLGLPNFTGFVEIISNIPIVSLSLNAEAFPVFSSLPAGDLPASTVLVP